MATATAVAEERLLSALVYLQCAAGCLILGVNQQRNSPYGRQATPRCRLRVPARVAWAVQELPSLALPLYQCASESAPRLRDAPNCILLAMFLVHYVQRSLIYPFLIRGGTPMPLFSCILATMFCTGNGYLQSRYLSHCAVYADDWLRDPRFLMGFGLWLMGMLINIHSDHILRNLRKPGDTGYKIPRVFSQLCRHSAQLEPLAQTTPGLSRTHLSGTKLQPKGGLFEYVTAANYFGEIVEWGGYALASWSVEGAAFAFFTFCFLCGRAKGHHQWYLQNFEEYPKFRKILIPFLF
ncbi:3-oxo-5-alpha-steroid 4-dehydrogenase 1 isoform X1 [Sapajus apella]|uniref:3-oxo-5alpha-steroid 4-dehydrogenase (NADP(+)) n=1 Tax=Sapajus apella TaxID=9515 RepID=A0A6J3HZD2_SAPAP|nr:3-oxo-5-alpha-steroid 4-dehydrogenase 1 isoform X1 [Sapajus apella]